MQFIISMLNDREACHNAFYASSLDAALSNEFRLGLNSLEHAKDGVHRFKQGFGRGGQFESSIGAKL